MTLRISSRIDHKHERIAAILEGFRREHQPGDDEGLPREVREVLDYIYDHLFDPRLNVSTVRAGCRLRDNNVSTRFRKVLGLGIREYIEQLRMLAASRLLEESDFEIYLVAMTIGYDHTETFCRAFQRHFGNSPSQSRENIKKGDQETTSTAAHRSSVI